MLIYSKSCLPVWLGKYVFQVDAKEHGSYFMQIVILPSRYIGGEIGTVISIYKLGCASDILPLCWVSATYGMQNSWCQCSKFEKAISKIVSMAMLLYHAE